METIGRRAARDMERHPERFGLPFPRGEKHGVDREQQDVFPPIGRDRQPAEFEIYDEPSSRLPLRRRACMSRRSLEQLLRGTTDGSDDDMAEVLDDVE